MKKNQLERILQKIPRISDPKPWLEQYTTPANIAADSPVHRLFPW